MPSIDVSMRRSVKEGFVDLLIASLRPVMERRDDPVSGLVNEAEDVKTAFSSWGNCMQASFCKWPVIAVIIVGGLILFSVAWCIIRCLCCGLSCCCSCFQCLKCCGDCCGCCDPPKGSRHKHLDDGSYGGPSYPPPNQAYKTQAPMAADYMPTVPTVAPVRSNAPPQYAEFDVSKRGTRNEDALPEMPSWETASHKKVLVEEEAVELNNLKKPEGSSQNVPLLTGTTLPGPASPSPRTMSPDHRSPYGDPSRSPYGDPNHSHGAMSPEHQNPYGDPNGTHLLGAEPHDPYGQGAHGYEQNSALAQPQQSFGMDQGPRMGGPPMGQGRQSPRALNDVGLGPERGYGPPPRQGSFDQYGRPRQGSDARQGNPGYGMGQRPGPRRSPRPGQDAYGPDRSRGSPAPQDDFNGYGGDYNNRPYGPSRQTSAESTRPLMRPPPQRQYSNEPATPASPLQNNSGFDFGSGFARPMADDDSRQPTLPHMEPTIPQLQPAPANPAQNQGRQAGYPGYTAYQPRNQPRNQPPQGGYRGF